jgi:hypothetical protein
MAPFTAPLRGRPEVTASLDTPLLHVLHNELYLHGPHFGYGLPRAQ